MGILFVCFADGTVESQYDNVEAHYQEGLRLSQKEGIDFQRYAAKEFKIVENLSPGYKDASLLYEKCRKAGTKRIAIFPFENESGKHKYGAIAELILDKSIKNIMDTPAVLVGLKMSKLGIETSSC